MRSEQGLVKRKPMYELIEEPARWPLTAPEKDAALFYTLYN